MQNITSLKKTSSLLISLALHLCVFILIGLYFDASSTTFKLGDKKTQVIASYLYENTSHQTEMAQEKSARTQSENGIFKINHKQKPDTAQSTQSKQKIRQSAASQGEKTSELLTLLHAAIQEQQHYPVSAIQMEREGRVTLKFTLHTDGTINDLTIIKSSGTSSLDEAALKAVQAAVPFKHIDKYLSTSQNYSINVAFELT